MTTPKTQPTTEEMRIEVLEWMGHDAKVCPIHHSRECCGRRLPALTLDWLHECEKKLSYDQLPFYCCNLTKVLMKEEGVSDFDHIHAAAEQRLKALWRTIKGL